MRGRYREHSQHKHPFMTEVRNAIKLSWDFRVHHEIMKQWILQVYRKPWCMHLKLFHNHNSNVIRLPVWFSKDLMLQTCSVSFCNKWKKIRNVFTTPTESVKKTNLPAFIKPIKSNLSVSSPLPFFIFIYNVSEYKQLIIVFKTRPMLMGVQYI